MAGGKVEEGAEHTGDGAAAGGQDGGRKDVEVGNVGLVNLAANSARCGAVSR